MNFAPISSPSKDRRRLTWRVAGAAILSAVNLAHADTVTLAANADTSLFASFPDNNLGATSSQVVGCNGMGLPGRELLSFDVAGNIPAGAVIQSAALTVTVVTVPGVDGGAPTCDLHRMLVSWVEGAGSGMMGSAANPGETTWNFRFEPNISWTTPGAGVSNDFSAAVSSSITLTGLGNFTFASTSNLVADVQQWLNNSATNFGWIIMSENETAPFTVRRIGARENSSAAPFLTVQYALSAPSAPAIQNFQVGAGRVQFNFAAAVGQAYAIQYRDSLAMGSWLTLTNISPQTSATNLLVTDAAPSPTNRFYRVATPSGP